MQKFRNNVIWTTALTLLSGACLGLLSLYFAAAGSGAMCRFYLKDPLLLALNVLPFALFALLLFGLTGRAWLAFLLDGVVCLVYSWAAYWKWLGRSEPLYADDVAAIREAVQIGGRGYITVTWQIVASLLLVAGGTLVLAWLARAVQLDDLQLLLQSPIENIRAQLHGSFLQSLSRFLLYSDAMRLSINHPYKLYG